MDASQERLRGYRKALDEASIAYDNALVRWGDWDVESGFRRTQSLMRQESPPTAIYCANDLMALGSFNALAELGLSVPDDVSVVGHNDLQFAAHAQPPLSSCRPPNYEMGKRAVEHIIDQVLGHEEPEPTTTRLECKLVVRSSVSFRRRDAATPEPAPVVGAAAEG
jgi:LacI family transcriptional regulator